MKADIGVVVDSIPSTCGSTGSSPRCAHPFRVIKRLFGHVKSRNRDLARVPRQLFTLFALGKLFLGRRRLKA
ncbi:MAG: hypothetical protein EP318_08705 [Rhodobacteraceae bacterium]|nr:MAG: hypothetical protein EP318_08705 [Paracoccaceae bacterium]